MNIRATCPANKDHSRFETVAHVSEVWEVDREGNFLSVRPGGGQVLHRPDIGNYWRCLECGAEAVVGRFP